MAAIKRWMEFHSSVLHLSRQPLAHSLAMEPTPDADQQREALKNLQYVNQSFVYA